MLCEMFSKGHMGREREVIVIIIIINNNSHMSSVASVLGTVPCLCDLIGTAVL